MRKFENAIILLDNLSKKSSISSNDLLNVFSRIIEEAGRSTGKTLSEIEITDEAQFADGITFLCEQLSMVIDSNRVLLYDSLPKTIRKLFEEDCERIAKEKENLSEILKQIEIERNKRMEAEDQEKILNQTRDTLSEEITILKKTIDNISSVKADISVKTSLRNDLLSKTAENQSLILEHQNSLTMVKNALSALLGSQDINDIMSFCGEGEPTIGEIGSFEDLKIWFQEYGERLQNGIEAYVETYKKIIDVLKD